MSKPMREWFNIQMQASGEAEILIYDAIGASFWDENVVTAKKFAEEFKDIVAKDPSQINVRINSPGGNVFDGAAIFNIIAAERARVVTFVDGLAASIASVVALAGSKVVMSENALFMIHNPTTCTCGDAHDMRKTADVLDKVTGTIANTYVAKTEATLETVQAKMDDETWFTADEAEAFGLVDEVVNGSPIEAIEAIFDVSKWESTYKHMPIFNMKHAEPPTAPAKLKEGSKVSDSKVEPTGSASYAELKAACAGADNDFICAQLDANATEVQARTAWMTEQTKRLEDANARVAAHEAKAAEPPGKEVGIKDGLDETGNGPVDEPTGDPIAAWEEAVQAQRTAGKSQRKAVAYVIKHNKELHAAFIEAHNANHGRAGKSLPDNYS